MPQVIIIGAGLTGLSTAYHLENAGFFDYELLECEPISGGLCRSVRQDGFTFDYTGHLLHLSDPYVRQMVDQVASLASFNIHERNSWVYSGGNLSKYPFQVNLRGMSVPVIADCIQEFVQRRRINNPRSFYSWVLAHFGRGFARHFFVPYQQKIFCYDTKKLSHSWTGRFVPATTLTDIIAGIVDEVGSLGYNANFYYPKSGGIDYLVNKFVAQVIKPIQYEHRVTEIDLEQKTVRCANGFHERYGVLINTTPLNSFLSCVRDTSTSCLRPTARKLRASNVLNINIGLQAGIIGADRHWVYVVDRQVPFYRAGCAHNFAHAMAPEGCQSLYIEYAYTGRPAPSIEQDIMRAAMRMFGFGLSDIRTYNVLRIEPAYVTYTFWRDQQLPALLARLGEHNIFCGGRYGAWQYASMQEALLDGRALAQRVLSLVEQKILVHGEHRPVQKQVMR